MDESKKSKGSKSSALPVLDPVSATARAGVTSTDEVSTDRTQADSGPVRYSLKKLKLERVVDWL